MSEHGDNESKKMATPSPSPSASATNSNSASRRPPRKSTLTQQQKNQKRQRATQDQLATLEQEFLKNPTPTASVRERIADEINMTERSVQIWFQNRRAKIKLLAKKGIEGGEDIDNIPEGMRQYLGLQTMESGRPMGANFMGRDGLVSYRAGGMMGADHGPQGKVLIHHFHCRSLQIGSWKRIGQTMMDLIIFYSPKKECMTYYINNDQAGYKIEYPFAYIKNIYLENGDIDGGNQGGLVVELNRPPLFFMDCSGSGGFVDVGDFTEEHQASQVLIHRLGGHPKVLSGQLAKLANLDSFINRHNPFESQHQLAVSAPNSPIGHRPASQPNYNAQAHVGMFQEQWGIGVHPGARGPGHKRQRSRSVPTAIDFSMFSAPMPSFLIQHPAEHQSHHNPNIFAPIPQQPQNLTPMGSNLRIDTSTGYGMDFRQYPMSAATTTPPSDYASPSFYSQGPETGPLPASSYNTPYTVPFLSPMVDPSSMVPPSVSPLSFMSHGDPAIVDQSPPLSMMHRSGSADAYNMNHASLSDDGSGLNEMYSKHSLTLPMHQNSPSPAYLEQSQADMEMNQLVEFEPMDPAGLSPEPNSGHR
ncbi:hypothetical protein VE00_00699 [Pseudogymnoascus sp. WSF 3629]|nr:hypothetical protein VE00_00699 [Pseudogymnoascus sp. WSF 3629]